MEKKRKKLAFFVALCLVLSLAGCGRSSGQTADNSGAGEKIAEEQVKTAEPVGTGEQGEPAKVEPPEQGGTGEQGEPVKVEPAEQGGTGEQGEPVKVEPAEQGGTGKQGEPAKVEPAEQGEQQEPNAGDSGAELQQEEVPTDFDIRQAIISNNHEIFPDSPFEAASYVVLATIGDGENASSVTVYVMALYEGYDFPSGTPEMSSAVSGPVALTFQRVEGGFQLTEYWEPDEGEDYMPSLREKFPSTIPEEDLDTQKYIVQLMADCDAQADAFSQTS